MGGTIETGVEDGIARVTLRNPARKNAVDLGMWEGLRAAFLRLADLPDLRVAVISGAGGDFSAGADIAEFEAHRKTPTQAQAYSDTCQAATDAILALPVPVIAEVRGFCLGAGTMIAMACDLRYLAEGVRVGIPAGKLGLAFETRWLDRLVAALGPGPAAEMLFTARAFDAAAALRMGMAQAVLPAGDLAAHVTALATDIAANAPLTMQAAKAGLRATLSGAEADRDRLAALVATCATSGDYQRALAAFARKDRPAFQGD